MILKIRIQSLVFCHTPVVGPQKKSLNVPYLKLYNRVFQKNKILENTILSIRESCIYMK